MVSFAGIARKLAFSGYAVFAMDYPGFGLSEGLHGYIRSFNRLVDDVIEHYSKVKGILANFSKVKLHDSFWKDIKITFCGAENPDFRGLPSFLFGQSM